MQWSRPELAVEISSALSHRNLAERGRIVRDIADLFLQQHADYSCAQVELFDFVLMKLIDAIEHEVRVYLAEKFASIDNAPRAVVHKLADDDAITVAGPVLAQARYLDEGFLIASAKNKGQEHLRAISSRKIVSQQITDVLVDRGDDCVVLTLAKNNGAALSDRGYSMMIERASQNGELAGAMWNRRDIPRQHLLALFKKASEAVRQQLEAQEGQTPELAAAVRLARQSLEELSRQSSTDYVAAREHIRALQESGGLSESHVLESARQGEFEKVVIAIAQLSGLAEAEIENMLLEVPHDRLFIMAKAIGLSWTTLRLILMMSQDNPMATDQLEQLRARYQSIARAIAIKTLQIHQLRHKARNGSSRRSC